jgi:hypothetical protein
LSASCATTAGDRLEGKLPHVHNADVQNKRPAERPRRFQISRKGELVYETHRFKCLIQDISQKGMFIICNYDLEIGLELTVKFELEPGLPFEAKVKVRHFTDGCFGAEIIEADPRSNNNWKQFIEDHYAGQSRLPERRSRL